MVIKHFTFNPDDPYLINARPGSPHPFFSMMVSASTSPDACTNCIGSLNSATHRRSSSAPALDKRVGAEAAEVEAEVELVDQVMEQTSVHHSLEEGYNDQDRALGHRASVLAFWKRMSIRRRRRPSSYFFTTPGEYIHFAHFKKFSLRELQGATDNFSHKNILGRAWLGIIYKGCLANGSLVAVKRIKEELSQAGESQLQIEVQIMNLAVHRNLLKLHGVCMTTTERLLVYPYMANGNVVSHLRGRPVSEPPLQWPIRKQIAMGVAKGLAYLHEHCNPKIIHRDVKAANILLDENFEAVLGSFRLVKLSDHGDIHVTTAVCGKIGHIAPEYLLTGVASDKTDVYGYGVILLELITGQRASDLARLAMDDDVMLLDWVQAFLRERRLETLIDSDINGNYVKEEVEQLVQVALLCTQVNASTRPNMSEVVGMLGEGLAARWEEWQEEGMLQRLQSVNPYASLVSGKKNHFGHSKRFSLLELQVATDNFSHKNMVGRGRFNFTEVYKGRLADGSLVAVKRLKEEFSQDMEVGFMAQVEIISLAAHRNLLKLHGFCITPMEQLLVYPYLPNGSVASHLRERPDSEPPLQWPVRKQIALGAARALVYLHEQCNPKIIHCDVNAANVLLDEDFEAVLGDFRLAKFIDYGDPRLTKAVSCMTGCLAPEYLSTGVVSDKTDVFGFGVMLLELITGQTADDPTRQLANDEDEMLLDWVKRLLRERRLEVLIDSDIHGDNIEEEVERLMHLGLAILCTQSNPTERPKMSEVVKMLEAEGLGDRLEEWQKDKMLRRIACLFYPDSFSSLLEDELIGPR